MGNGSTPREALELTESVLLVEAASSGSITKPDGTVITLGYDGSGNPKEGGTFDAHGRVPVHVIRPGLGKGRGRHLYEARMLQANAQKFAGWKQYVNHLSPEARKAQGGLPRDVRDLGGRLQETWWDGGVPADPARGYEAGAVVGMSRPVKFVRDLIDDDPELVEASISATATGVKPTLHGGQRAWLVEGINDRGSLDWVTEGGAGGRVAPLLEAAYADERLVELALVESLDPEELRDYLRGRPVAAASRPEPPEGDDVALTPEAIQEALTSSPNIIQEAVVAALATDEGQEAITTIVEARMDDERTLMEAKAQARVDRAFQLAALERQAHAAIAESKLPDSWQTDLRARFSLIENRPSAELDVHDEVDADGKVTKSAKDKLAEALTEALTSERAKLSEARPTRVRGAGGGSNRELEEGRSEGEGGEKKENAEKPYWATVLSEAGFQDPEKIYSRA